MRRYTMEVGASFFTLSKSYNMDRSMAKPSGVGLLLELLA